METNKIISVRGSHSEWFEHAIFILKGSAVVNKDIVAEAERIINEYMMANSSQSARKTANRSGIHANGQLPANNTVIGDGKLIDSAYTQPINSVNKKRRVNYASLFMNIGLIICCVLFGALAQKLLS